MSHLFEISTYNTFTIRRMLDIEVSEMNWRYSPALSHCQLHRNHPYLSTTLLRNWQLRNIIHNTMETVNWHVCVCVWHPKVKFNYGKIHYRIVESFRILILTFHFNPPWNKREDAGSSSLINATNQPTTTDAFLVWSALQSFQIEIPERPWNGFYIKVATGNTLKILQLQSHLHT